MIKEGIIASSGIAIATAFVYAKVELNIEETTVTDTEGEITRLQGALTESKAQLAGIKEKAAADLGAEEAEIFE
ncbi:MAG: phosphoenolpyruvate-utilizing N-terminal domain-containing protein, partial [Eubacterium sp.]